jgi:hypothetical protein
MLILGSGVAVLGRFRLNFYLICREMSQIFVLIDQLDDENWMNALINIH